jgi:hypothetical protein
MVEVFKTNINKVRQSKLLIKKLSLHFPASCINFDLDDCDNVLRLEGEDICPHKVITLVTENGYQCEVLT